MYFFQIQKKVEPPQMNTGMTCDTSKRFVVTSRENHILIEFGVPVFGIRYENARNILCVTE